MAALLADDAHSLAGVPAQEVGTVLSHRYQTLQACSFAERQTAIAIGEVERRLAARQAQLERIATSVEAVLAKKAQRKEIQRREEIRRCVAEHLQDVEQQCHTKHQEAWALSLKLTGLLAQESDVVTAMMEQAQRVGVLGQGDFQNVERELSALLKDDEDEEEDSSFF